MVTRIKSIAVLQLAKLLALLYAFLGVIMLPIVLLQIASSPEEKHLDPLGIVIFLIIYPIIGFASGIILAALYNLTARIVGGIQLTLQLDLDTDHTPNPL